jgi:ring-1,2-phenylacetyl-CoA epoxidase subunit PaaC
MTQKNIPQTFDSLSQYVLHLADNVMILGQQLGDWCGHGPVLEQDIALTNISLDLIGQARMYYQYAARLIDEKVTEDDLAFLRSNRSFFNMLLVEQPNGDWGQTIMRQFLFDTWNLHFLQKLSESKDDQLAAIAAKSLKEVQYHIRYSSEWVLRLGDGTEESHQKMQNALDLLWDYAEEWSIVEPFEQELIHTGIAPDPKLYKNSVDQYRKSILQESTLIMPVQTFSHKGGKMGFHSEYLDHILAEMQIMQRSYPGLEW